MIIVPERLPIPVEGLMFGKHGRIRVAPALGHSDGYGIAALFAIKPVTLTSVIGRTVAVRTRSALNFPADRRGDDDISIAPRILHRILRCDRFGV